MDLLGLEGDLVVLGEPFYVVEFNTFYELFKSVRGPTYEAFMEVDRGVLGYENFLRSLFQLQQ